MDDKELQREKYQAKLDEWDAEVDRLKAKAAGASAEAKIQVDQHLRALEDRMREARQRLDEMRDAGKDSWDAMKGDLEDSWNSLKKAFREASDALER